MPTAEQFTITQRRRGLFIAEVVKMLANQSADEVLRVELNRVVRNAQRRYGYSPSEKKEAVMDALLDGAQTVHDLIIETGFPKQVLWPLIRQLECESPPRIKVNNQDRRGRPLVIIVPILAKTPNLSPQKVN